MHKYFLLSLFVLLLSCGRNKEKERERAEYVEDSIAKANEEKRFRESRERIIPIPEPPKPEKKQAKASLLSSLPKKWVLLGIYRQQKVIFIPCGAEEAPYFVLQDVNGAHPKIFVNYGNEQKTYFIAKVRQDGGKVKFNLVRYYEEDGGMTSNYDLLNLDLINKGKELTVDMTVNEPGVGKTRFDMVPEDQVKNYMVVKQDPEECEGQQIQ